MERIGIYVVIDPRPHVLMAPGRYGKLLGITLISAHLCFNGTRQVWKVIGFDALTAFVGVLMAPGRYGKGVSGSIGDSSRSVLMAPGRYGKFEMLVARQFQNSVLMAPGRYGKHMRIQLLNCVCFVLMAPGRYGKEEKKGNKIQVKCFNGTRQVWKGLSA